MVENTDLFDLLTSHALTISVAMTRIAIAFLILPVFSSEILPSLVKNALFVSLTIFTLILFPETVLANLTIKEWILLYLKEVYLGLSIGVLFGVFMWAFEAGGQLIDGQIGLSQAQVHDSVSGTQTTLIGLFVARFANYVFISAGGLMYLAAIIFESFSLWPIDKPLPNLSLVGVELFENEFKEFLRLLVLIAAPMLIVVLFIDGIMGLLNRYAQQFNVFFLSMSLKLLAALSILFFLVPSIAEIIINNLVDHAGKFPEVFNSILTK
jgi:type III secretion protein T